MKVYQCKECGKIDHWPGLGKQPQRCKPCARTRDLERKKAEYRARVEATKAREGKRTTRAYFEVIKQPRKSYPFEVTLISPKPHDVKGFGEFTTRADALKEADKWAKIFGWNPTEAVDVMC